MSIALAVLAGLVWGALAAVVNYFIMKKSIEKNTNNAVISSSMLRTAIDVAALGAVFLARNVLPFDFTYALIACAVAMSIGTIVFTFRLAKK